MECMNLNSISESSDHLHEALSHGLCSRMSECQTQDRFRSTISNSEDICNTQGKKLGFPWSWSRNNHNRTIDNIYCLFLGIIEMIIFLLKKFLVHIFCYCRRIERKINLLFKLSVLKSSCLLFIIFYAKPTPKYFLFIHLFNK